MSEEADRNAQVMYTPCASGTAGFRARLLRRARRIYTRAGWEFLAPPQDADGGSLSSEPRLTQLGGERAQYNSA